MQIERRTGRGYGKYGQAVKSSIGWFVLDAGSLVRKDLYLEDDTVDLIETSKGGRLAGSEWRIYILPAVGLDGVHIQRWCGYCGLLWFPTSQSRWIESGHLERRTPRLIYGKQASSL